MASIGNDPNGRKRILFVDPDPASKKRRAVRLGKMTEDEALAIKHRIEQLIDAVRMGTGWRPDTKRWIEREVKGTRLYSRLAHVGLVPKLNEQVKAELAVEAEALAAAIASIVRLGPHIDAYIAKRTDVKPRTILIYEQTRRSLVNYFSADKPLREVTIGNTNDWRRWLASHTNGEGLAPNTIRKRCQVAKQYFQDAVDNEIIDKNPFAKMKGLTIKKDRNKFFFIKRSVADKILAACPDAQWQLIFALSRYGGLRCPSEHLALTWGDVDFDNSRLHVRSPKTERYKGKESRIVPLFPELRPHFEAVRDELLASEDFDPKLTPMSKLPVITRYRDSNSNLRTQLLRILKRAGVEPWASLFHNLRSARQTELADQFPIQVVCRWMGNSQVVAKHYLQVTDDHFAAAIENRYTNPAQQGHVSGRNDSQMVDEQDAETAYSAEQSEFCGSEQYTRQESNLQPSDS